MKVHELIPLTPSLRFKEDGANVLYINNFPPLYRAGRKESRRQRDLTNEPASMVERGKGKG
jgi:hypothetical protein